MWKEENIGKYFIIFCDWDLLYEGPFDTFEEAISIKAYGTFAVIKAEAVVEELQPKSRGAIVVE